METNRQVEVAWSQEELNQKIEALRAQGYNESDIHVVAREPDRFQLTSTDTQVDTHEAGTFWDRFKSFFTGEDATTESLSRLNLEQHEQDRYATDLTNGGAILYVESLTRSNDYTTSDETATGTVGTGFVNQRFTEPESRLGEHTPEENKHLFKSENQTYTATNQTETHVENDAYNIEPRMTEEQKDITDPTFQSTKTTPTGYEERQAYGSESPGSDPNLGPAAFGNLEPAMEDNGREPAAVEDSLSNHEHEERVKEVEDRRSENHMQDRQNY